jgi:hypothetical protein
MTPEQEEQVRRALAAVARHEPASIPPDVAARLDTVLAQLAAGEAPAGDAGDTGDTRVTASSPGHRHPHRRWPGALVAAAALVVVALGGGAVALHGLTGSGSSSSRAGAASSTHAQGRSSVVEGGSSPSAAVAMPLLRTATLTRDVQRVVDTEAAGSPLRQAGGAAGDALRSRGPTSASSEGSGPASGGQLLPGPAAISPSAPPAAPQSAAASAREVRPGCAVPSPAPGGRLLAVRLDRRPAWLAVPTRPGTGVARVYSCGSTGTPLATTTVHVP